MDPVLLAFLFGALSAASLPIGAAVGILTRPGMRLTAAIMAFGAGSLLCALALELVVPALAHFPDQPLHGFAWLASGCLIGALLFIGLDHLLSEMGGYLRKASTIATRLRRVKKEHYQDLLDRLSVLDLVVALPAKEVRRIIHDIEKRSFAAGEIICHEDDPCDALYLIESGQVRIYDPQMRSELLAEELLNPGDAFGETVLVTGDSPVARAVAIFDTVVWEIHKDDFDEVVAVSPQLRARLKQLAITQAQGAGHFGRITPEQSELWLAAASANLDSELGRPTETEVLQAAHNQKLKGSNVALAMWLGIALDGIPESLIIGSSMEGTQVSIALIGGLFMANFPESMSSAVVMRNQGSSNFRIMGMWSALMLMTGFGAALGNLYISEAPIHVQAVLEGICAGAMLAMIAQTMLPEAYEHGGWLTGLLTVIGFIAAIGMGTLDEGKREGHVTGHVSPPAISASLAGTG